MDIITAKLGANMAINSLVANGQIGCTTIGDTVMTFDWSYYYNKLVAGDYTVFVGEIPLAKILDRPIEKNEVQSITVKEIGTFSGDALMAQDFSDSCWAVMIVAGDEPMGFIIVAPEDWVEDGTTLLTKGTYAMFDVEGGNQTTGEGCIYVAEICGIQGEVIKPIDPKYLPSGAGGGLPVVTITTLPNWSEDGSEAFAPLTDKESAELTAAAATNLPCIINMSVNGAIVANVTTYVKPPEGQGAEMYMFINTASEVYTFVNAADSWAMTVTPME